ncbi:unnamed protein product [Ilex paraguariensis]|uniref:Uncharacterized protein n=1 Tax=Ilex paraguariensis TaxID=185542 RepID=A0ABC8U587_9AQUA
MDCAKATSDVRKVKKKQVRDELDRIKRAAKKKRRLEKALATSAAICSELEKKKLKKKEEQQRLDDEGAAIAEAVALHVLLGEDSDDPCKIMMKKNEGFNPWDCGSDFDLFVGGRKAALTHQGLPKYSVEGIGWVSDAHISGCNWNNWGNSTWTVSSNPFAMDFQTPYFDEGGWRTSEISEDLIAAQAVSSLQIAEDAHIDAFVFNQMFRGYDEKS